MKKIIIGLVVLVALGGGYYIFSKKEAKAPAVENSTNNLNQNPTTSGQPATTPSAQPQTQTGVKGNTGADYTPPQTEAGGENPGSNIQVSEVDFDGTAYTPSVSKIKAGDYIFFKNKSSGDFWPVAGSANTIAAYPKFNPAAPIAAGKEYRFQFTKAGDWNFGDNLKANAVFEVSVSQ